MAQVRADASPDLVSDLYAVMGDILYKKKDKQAAYAAYDSCLQWKDDNVMALNNYAYYMSVEGIRPCIRRDQMRVLYDRQGGTETTALIWIPMPGSCSRKSDMPEAKTLYRPGYSQVTATLTENNSTVSSMPATFML